MGGWELYKDHNLEIQIVTETRLKTRCSVEMIKTEQGWVTIVVREFGLLKMVIMKLTCGGRLEVSLRF